MNLAFLLQFISRWATFFYWDWSWNNFYGHSLPTAADSSWAVVSYWQKNGHLVQINRLGSLPRNCVVGLTDHLDMTIIVGWDVKPQIKFLNEKHLPVIWSRLCHGAEQWRSRPIVGVGVAQNVEVFQTFISRQPLIRKHSYLDNRYPGGPAFMPWLLTPGSMVRDGARGQILEHLFKVFFYFAVIKTTWADSWSDFGQSCDIDMWVLKWRQHDLYFTVQWFCLISLQTIWCMNIILLPYILKTTWCMNIILWDYESVWHDIWPQNKCRSLTYITWSSNFDISWRLFDMNIILWDYESIWHDIWPQNKCRSLWPIFHGPVILPYILKTIWYMNTTPWDYESVWHDVWPKN